MSELASQSSIVGTRREISRKVVALFKEFVGRGPRNARTYIDDDLILVVLDDTLTKAEKTLAEDDRVGLVREMRRSFEGAMRDRVIEMIEAESGRKVRTVLHDHSVLPDYAIEAFVLEPEGGSNGDAASGASENGENGERSQQREISRGMVGVFKEFVGRGPSDARTYFFDEIVAVLLGNTLTKAERSLADDDRANTVRELRRQFQGTMSERMIELVENGTGRKVSAFMSDHSIYPDYAIEVFLMDSIDEAIEAGE